MSYPLEPPTQQPAYGQPDYMLMSPPPQYYPQQQPEPPRPPKKKRMWILWLSLSVTVVLVGVIIGAGYVVNRFISFPSDLFESATGKTLEEVQKGGRVFDGAITMSERPGFQVMVDEAETTLTKYKEMPHDEIAKLFPGGVSGFDHDYYKAFLYIISDLRNAMRFMSNTYGTDPGEFDDQIAGMRAEVAETERKFLSQEDFDVQIEISLSDGGKFVSDGKYRQNGATKNPGNKKDTPKNAPKSDPDAFASGFQAYTDADGRYVTAAAELAAGFGVGIDYEFSHIRNHCISSGSVILDESNVRAAFCSVTPDRIYVNNHGHSYPGLLAEPRFIDTVKHELSHARILDRCKTTAPVAAAAAGVHYEGVTNSYAVLFMGASREELARDAPDEYQMNETTDRVARQVKEGQCG